MTPMFRQPGGLAKVLRRVSQGWLDPEGEVMEPRAQQSEFKSQFKYLAMMLRELVRDGPDNKRLAKRRDILLESPAYLNKSHREHQDVVREVNEINRRLGEEY